MWFEIPPPSASIGGGNAGKSQSRMYGFFRSRQGIEGRLLAKGEFGRFNNRRRTVVHLGFRFS